MAEAHGLGPAVHDGPAVTWGLDATVPELRVLDVVQLVVEAADGLVEEPPG
jgi:hypothetical protein